MTFIDDDTILSWVYLMKDKYDMETIFKSFYIMVQTQFKKIFKYCRVIMIEGISKMFWTKFFLKKETVHPSSYIDTPQ